MVNVAVQHVVTTSSSAAMASVLAAICTATAMTIAETCRMSHKTAVSMRVIISNHCTGILQSVTCFLSCLFLDRIIILI